MMHRNATNAVRPPSLVDTLSSGFRTLHRAYLALLVPIALDLWYWLGPRISPQPLVAWLRSFNTETWDAAREQAAPLLPQDRPFDLRIEGILEGRWFFWFWRRIYTFVPSGDAARPWEPATWYVGGFGVLFGTLIVLNVVFALLVVLYLLPLADAVRGNVPAGRWPRRVMSAWLRVMGVQGLVLALLIVGGIPLLVVAGAVAQFAPLVGSFLGSALLVLVLWLMFTTSFAYDAVVLNGSNPVRALLSSLFVVRTSFWSVIGLYLLSGVILAGLGVIWQGFQSTIIGMLAAMFTSAYVGAGLAAAHLIFYRNRLPARAGAT
jgi:hypothetical protein